MKLVIYITKQTFVYQFDANYNQIDDWQGKSNFLTCGKLNTLDIVGLIILYRIFIQLKPHSHYRVDAEVLSIDGYKAPNFYIYNVLAKQEIAIPPQEDQIYGKSQQENFLTISIFGQHNRRTFWVSIRQLS